tara:strand:- start:63 stop:716 length:654 start_codon:yes stop_codon:yes gene_type:complete
MFNYLFSKTKFYPKFTTEKELILYIIENCTHDSISHVYRDYALTEWKEKHTAMMHEWPIYDYDDWLIRHLSKVTDDEDIIRAIFKVKDSGTKRSEYTGNLIFNKNLPIDIIKEFLTAPLHSRELTDMSMMEYKYITKEIKDSIEERIVSNKIAKRKRKEDKTRDKLKAYLLTVNATKSVLNGRMAVNDIVEQTITSDVNDQVLDYMCKIFDVIDKKV